MIKMSIEYLEHKTTNYLRSRRRLQEIEDELSRLREEKRIILNANYQPLSDIEVNALRDKHQEKLRMQRSTLLHQGYVLFPKYWIFECKIDYQPVTLFDLLDHLIFHHKCSVEYSNTMRLSCHPGDIIRLRQKDESFIYYHVNDKQKYLCSVTERSVKDYLEVPFTK